MQRVPRSSRARAPGWTLLVTILGLLLVVGLPISGTSTHGLPHPLASTLSPPRVAEGARATTAPAATPGASAVTVSVAGTTPSAVSLAWTQSTDVFFSQYTVFESTNATAGPWQSVGVVTSASTTSLAVTGLSPGATYGWQVQETGFLGSTANSTPVESTQPNLSFLQYHTLTSSSIQLNWTNNAS